MDKFNRLVELCEQVGFNCDFEAHGTKQFAIVSCKETVTFAQAAMWEENWNIVFTIFPRATMQTVNTSDKERVAVFCLGDIMEILRG